VSALGLVWRPGFGQDAPTTTPTPVGTCITSWEESRETTINRQEAYKLVGEVLQRSGLSPAQLRGCGYVYGLLDRVRTDAKLFTIGKFEILLGEGKEQLAARGGFDLSGSGIDANVIGDSRVGGFLGASTGTSFEGEIYLDGKQKRFSMKSEPGGADVRLPELWRGTVPKGAKPWGKNVPVQVRFYAMQQGPLSMQKYIDEVLLNAGGAHFGGDNLSREIAEHFDKTLASLERWSQGVWRASSGLISVHCAPGTVYKVILDGSEIGETPFTFPVTVEVAHKIAFRGASGLTERVVTLKDGELLSILAP
jgi:hypothetical protein